MILAEQDHAILVAISRYRDDLHYPDLDGPLNDHQAFYNWLVDKDGGNVPAENIHRLATSEELARMGKPRPSGLADVAWEPSKHGFKSKVEKVIQDPDTAEFIKRDARLYMHFAGHGFSSDWEALQSASLVPADVFGNQMEDIPGTLYMEGIRKMALYSEIVLIMDCCRTLTRTGTYSQTGFRPFSASNQECVRVMSAYAVPKDGSAQERVLDESDGKPVGLLTHAFLRAIREIPPDILGRVSDNAIDQFLAIQWRHWFFDKSAPPSPRIYPPPSALPRIFFKSGQRLTAQTFSVLADAGNLEFQLDSAHLPAIHAMVQGDVMQWERPMDSASLISMPLSATDADGRRSFTLMLLPEKYRIDFGIESLRPQMIFQPGSNRVDL